MKKFELADEDGNELAAIDLTTDVGQAIWLLEYCRIRGFKVGPRIQIGDVILEVQDLRQDGPKGPPDPGIWRQHGHDE